MSWKTKWKVVSPHPCKITFWLLIQNKTHWGTASNRCVNPVRNSNLRFFFQKKGPLPSTGWRHEAFWIENNCEFIASIRHTNLVKFGAFCCRFFPIQNHIKLGLSGNNCALFIQKLWVISNPTWGYPNKNYWIWYSSVSFIIIWKFRRNGTKLVLLVMT